ncbi:MAG TPA: isocitrate/isopropylmalate family dehydrogenase [Trinickia sp.]|nr:isocitrate/isopropylmalate family dehydrogenase [Trinickia sp.]
MRILILAGARYDAPIARQTLAALETLNQQNNGLHEVRVASNADDARVMAESETLDAMLVVPGAATARQIERLAMRTGLFAAVHALRGSSPGGRAFDIVVVGDPFQGQGQSEGERGVIAQRYELVGANTLRYTETSIRRLAKVALDAAQQRACRLTSVDQADRLETMELWRDVVAEAASRHADIAVEHRLIEQAVIELVASPQRFDTLVAGGNLGGILAAQIGALTGSPGTWARALVGHGRFAIYEIAAAHHACLGPDVPPDVCPAAVQSALSLMFRYAGNDPRRHTPTTHQDAPVAHEHGPFGL